MLSKDDIGGLECLDGVADTLSLEMVVVVAWRRGGGGWVVTTGGKVANSVWSPLGMVVGGGEIIRLGSVGIGGWWDVEVGCGDIWDVAGVSWFRGVMVVGGGGVIKGTTRVGVIGGWFWWAMLEGGVGVGGGGGGIAGDSG